MNKTNLKTILIVIGIVGSVAAGIALFIVGGVTYTFSISIVGICVIIGGIIITSACALLPIIKQAARDFKSNYTKTKSAEQLLLETSQLDAMLQKEAQEKEAAKKTVDK